MKILVFVGLLAFVTSIWTPVILGALPDLIIDPDSITFSDTSPMEGDPISISAAIYNKGDTDINKDIEVRFVEGDPEKGGLQIGSDAILIAKRDISTEISLKVGDSAIVDVKWRAAPGKTKIYLFVDPDNMLEESNEGNNSAVKLIEVRKWEGAGVTDEQIKKSIENGLDWLRTQQGEFYVTCPDGHDNFLYSTLAYGKCVVCGKVLKGIEPTRAPGQTMPGGWMAEIGPGMTALAIMTFLHAGMDESDPAVSMGIDHLLNKAPVKPEEWSDPYDHAVGILGLTSTGGTGMTGRDITPEAVRPLLDKEIEGIGELFRLVSYKEIGTSTVASRALGGVANGTFIFCLPGSTGACRTGWDKIIGPQLDYRNKPCNMVELMPRLLEK